MFIPSHITPAEHIQEELQTIQAFLEVSYAADQPAEVSDRFVQLGVYMARTGKLKADAEHWYNQLLASSIMEALKRGYERQLSATTINKYVEAESRGYKYLLTWADLSLIHI